MEPREARTIPSLDGLRAISIVLVLLGHGIGGAEGHSFLFRFALLHADLGVRIFFVISGFLITRLLIEEKERFGSISLRLFYIRRALRILPAFLAYVGVAFALSAFGVIEIPARLWIFVLTYTINFTQSVWQVGHLWSLSVEEHFYMLWPLAMRFASLRACVWIAVTAIFGGVLVRGLFVTTGYELINPQFRYATPLVLGPIAMGCLLAMAQDRVRRFIGAFPQWTGATATAAGIGALLAMDALDLGSANRILRMVMDLVLTGLLARFVFVPGGLAGRVLNSAPLVFVGKLSYSLYLWQQLSMNPFGHAILNRFPWNLLVACAAGCASWFVIETRFLRLRQRFRRVSLSPPAETC